MSLRARYEEINEQIKKLDDQSNLIYNEIATLNEEQAKIIQTIIKTEKALEGSSWELKLNNDRVYLVCLDKREDAGNPLRSIDVLINNTYHYSFNLEEGVEIRFDDDEISIHFEENKLAMPCIKQYKLKVTSGTIATKMQALKRQVNQLELIAHQFNIKG
jgi:GTP-sensing pleiotropic transcriptional regulator CodY